MRVVEVGRKESPRSVVMVMREVMLGGWVLRECLGGLRKRM